MRNIVFYERNQLEIEIAANQKHFGEVENDLTDIKFFQRAPQLLSSRHKSLRD